MRSPPGSLSQLSVEIMLSLINTVCFTVSYMKAPMPTTAMLIILDTREDCSFTFI